jgi:hypothetical protein
MASKNLTRTEFLKISAGFLGASAVPFMFGCPGDDTGDEGAGSTTADPPGTSTGDPDSSSGTPPGTDTGSSSGDPDSSSGTPPGTDTGSSSGMPGTDSSSGGETSSNACTTDPDVMIESNHGHELVVPLADVEAGVEATYNIQGTSMHPHSVTLTAEHFTMLQQGMQVVVDSSMDAMHTHAVTVSCA